jgi:hypothetical protein
MNTLQECLLAAEAEERGEAHGPEIFEIWQELTGEYRFKFPDEVNQPLSRLICQFNHETGMALCHLAEAAEAAQVLWKAAGLPAHDEGLIGLGMRATAIKVAGNSAESLPDVLKRIADGEAISVSTRFVLFHHRDGSRHRVDHDADKEPQINDFTLTEIIAGGVEHGLARILNSMVPEDIPIPPVHG